MVDDHVHDMLQLGFGLFGEFFQNFWYHFATSCKEVAPILG